MRYRSSSSANARPLAVAPLGRKVPVNSAAAAAAYHRSHSLRINLRAYFSFKTPSLSAGRQSVGKTNTRARRHIPPPICRRGVSAGLHAYVPSRLLAEEMLEGVGCNIEREETAVWGHGMPLTHYPHQAWTPFAATPRPRVWSGVSPLESPGRSLSRLVSLFSLILHLPDPWAQRTSLLPTSLCNNHQLFFPKAISSFVLLVRPTRHFLRGLGLHRANPNLPDVANPPTPLSTTTPRSRHSIYMA